MEDRARCVWRGLTLALLLAPAGALACGKPECGSGTALAGASASAAAVAGAVAKGGSASAVGQGGTAQASQQTSVTVAGARYEYGDRVPDLVAPGLTTSGDDMCTGSVSGGLGLSGIGAALGWTYTDDHCKTIKATKLLVTIGRPDAAIRRACMDDKMAQALGDECPARPAPQAVSGWSH